MGKPLPGVAQVAMQQGRYAGNLIHRRLTSQPAPEPFGYFDKGSMAVVGKDANSRRTLRSCVVESTR